MENNETVWKPSKEYAEATRVKRFMDREGFQTYESLVQKSARDISWWWAKCERELGLEWFEPYSKVVDMSGGIEFASWFTGGSINLTHNAVDKIAASHGGSTAFIWQGEDGSERKTTYSELARETNMLSNYLKGIGVKKGDVVSSCIPMCPEVIAYLFAATKIGAVFSPIFCGYGATAISSRLSDSSAKVVLTSDGYFRRGKKIELKRTIDEAIALAGSKHSQNVLVVERLKADVSMKNGRDFSYDEIKSESTSCDAEHTLPDDPAILLYTSGTTGKPKGAVISQVGAMLQPGKELAFNLDVRKDDVFLWISDIGWMMGPWQIIGAQLAGATHMILEGAPDHPRSDRIWELIAKHKITHLGHSATTMRLLKKYGEERLQSHDLHSLRALGNTGEPIDPDTWTWEMKFVGNWQCPMLNLSGGTEIFGGFLMPSPIVELKPSTLWGPALGMDIDVLDDNGSSVRGEIGYLVCRKPAPSMTRGFWNDFNRYIETYWKKFPGVWYHGDWAFVDSDGYWFLEGRADDVIKVAGRRIGPAEIESVVNSHPLIAESAAIGVPDEFRGEKLFCFVQLKPNVETGDKIIESVRSLVIQNLGKTLDPDRIILVRDLPRTRSGKIVRRLIKSAVLKDGTNQDTSTLENPDSLEEIRKRASDEG